MRTRLLFAIVVLALVSSLMAAACSTSESEEPIKIGVLAALTGRPQQAKESLHGLELALNEVNSEVASRKIELIVEDVANDPALALTKVKKLKEMDNVDIVIGPMLTAQGLAIRDYINDNKLLTVSPMCPALSLIEENYTEYFFRSSYTDREIHALAAYVAYKVKGYRKAVAFTHDSVEGYEAIEPFKEVFEALGGTVVQEIYAPMRTPDYGPYMAQIDIENADFVWSHLIGQDAVLFVRALDQYGIKAKLPMFFSNATCEGSWLPAQGDSALGIEDVSHYSAALDTPENIRFKQAIWDKYQEEVTLYTEHAYVAAKMIILALEEVNGNVENTDKLIEAMETLELEAPRGPIKFEHHTPVQNVYQRVVEEVDGKLQNTVIGTYPDIGPYWLPEELQ